VRDTVRILSTVFGTAEVRVDSAIFSPADYLIVRLEGRGGNFEALTDQRGQYFLERVPAGAYRLRFLTPTKEARVVYDVPVTVEPGPKVRLTAVHIPVESMKIQRP
jgi:hypothetical protein